LPWPTIVAMISIINSLFDISSTISWSTKPSIGLVGLLLSISLMCCLLSS
jgi:hypothetical protein